jgi:hypothetical protein
MTVASELEQIRKKNGGILRPKDVVAFARSPKTELHAHFEWDDSAAAKQYRLEQARLIIRCRVHMVHKDMPPTRVYVSLESDRKEGDSYRTLTDVLSDTEHRQQLLDQAYREMEAWRHRYEQFAELADVVHAIKKVQRKRKTGGRGKKKRKGKAA